VLQRRLDTRQRQAGALGVQVRGKPFAQAQRVEHELERQRVARHLVLVAQRGALQRLGHVGHRLAPALLPHHAMRETQLAVGACTDAEVVAELPIV